MSSTLPKRVELKLRFRKLSEAAHGCGSVDQLVCEDPELWSGIMESGPRLHGHSTEVKTIKGDRYQGPGEKKKKKKKPFSFPLHDLRGVSAQATVI
jgi:hypothetical protein